MRDKGFASGENGFVLHPLCTGSNGYNEDFECSNGGMIKAIGFLWQQWLRRPSEDERKWRTFDRQASRFGETGDLGQSKNQTCPGSVINLKRFIQPIGKGGNCKGLQHRRWSPGLSLTFNRIVINRDRSKIFSKCGLLPGIMRISFPLKRPASGRLEGCL